MRLEVVEGPDKRGQMQASFLGDIEFEGLEAQFFSLPFSDLRRWIPENDLLLDVQKAFPLGRLGSVKQLSFLSYAGPDHERVRMMPLHIQGYYILFRFQKWHILLYQTAEEKLMKD